MAGLCKVWNGESVPHFTQPFGRRRLNRHLPHSHRLGDGYSCSSNNNPEGVGHGNVEGIDTA